MPWSPSRTRNSTVHLREYRVTTGSFGYYDEPMRKATVAFSSKKFCCSLVGNLSKQSVSKLFRLPMRSAQSLQHVCCGADLWRSMEPCAWFWTRLFSSSEVMVLTSRHDVTGGAYRLERLWPQACREACNGWRKSSSRCEGAFLSGARFCSPIEEPCRFYRTISFTWC